MASTTNTTSLRGVLSPRDVNATTSPKKSTIFTSRTESPLKISQTSITMQEKVITTVYPQTSRGVNDLGPDDIEAEHRPSKRARRESYQTSGEEEYDALVAGRPSWAEGMSHPRDHRETVRHSLDGTIIPHDAHSPSAPASPASSFGSGFAALNDSQNTILTEPDDVPTSFPRPVIHRLTKGEAREKAEALKLRLRLASYRVFTNQITTPWKDLEARTMPLGKLRISQSSPVQSPNHSPSRQPSQDVVTHAHSKESTVTSNMPSSPPAPYTIARPGSAPAGDTAVNTFPTLLPPRPEDTGNISSFITSNTENADLIDNAVKRSIASDGLLSLMRQDS